MDEDFIIMDGPQIVPLPHDPPTCPWQDNAPTGVAERLEATLPGCRERWVSGFLSALLLGTEHHSGRVRRIARKVERLYYSDRHRLIQLMPELQARLAQHVVSGDFLFPCEPGLVVLELDKLLRQKG